MSVYIIKRGRKSLLQRILGTLRSLFSIHITLITFVNAINHEENINLNNRTESVNSLDTNQNKIVEPLTFSKNMAAR